VPATFDALAVLFPPMPPTPSAVAAASSSSSSTSSSSASRAGDEGAAAAAHSSTRRRRSDSDDLEGSTAAPATLDDGFEKMMSGLRGQFADSAMRVARSKAECKSLSASLTERTDELKRTRQAHEALRSAHLATHRHSMLISHCERYSKWDCLDSLTKELRAVLDRHWEALSDKKRRRTSPSALREDMDQLSALPPTAATGWLCLHLFLLF
jgi:hypothetical protein